MRAEKLMVSRGFGKVVSWRGLMLALVMKGTEDTRPFPFTWPFCTVILDMDGLGVDSEVLYADAWGWGCVPIGSVGPIDGRGVLRERGTPPRDGRGAPLSDGRGTPPNGGLGALPNEGLGTPGRGVPIPIPTPSPAHPFTLTPPAEPSSRDPMLDALEYVRRRESEGGYFLGVSGRGGSDLSMLHSDGVDERDGSWVGLGR